MFSLVFFFQNFFIVTFYSLLLAQSNAEQSPTNDQVEATNVLSSKATIRNLLSGPIHLNSLVNTLVITVLRHSENVFYLDRYGPRLAQLITRKLFY